MHFLPEDISDYADNHTQQASELLQRIDRETHTQVLKPRMLSGHLQGRFLAMLSRLINPRRILEIGTYTGYSALCLAEGLSEDGKLITIEANEELAPRINRYFSEPPFAGRIELRLGKALEVIPTLTDVFDIVFIDADKANYMNYYELVINKVRPGGLIIIDNILWSGKVVSPNIKASDKETHAILDFNHAVHADSRVTNLLLPIRDGVMLLQKNASQPAQTQ